MSRVGKRLIPVPDGVTLTVGGLDGGCQRVSVKGTNGELHLDLADCIQANVTGNILSVERSDDSRRSRSFHGLSRALISNMVQGVSEGFEKVLEIHGLGYKAKLEGDDLVLALGYCHPIVYKPPQGIKIHLETDVVIKVRGADKQQVGQVAADIRSFRGPEPYKGKGIRYRGERIRRKQGKAGA
ncbi:MAG: 50S ribosomal protein L6 [Candidatus Coatesbacteria bacterium]|nr:50S ribosomal protein L6 [Candidatus Coatesbacteria bacterium]